MKCSSETLQNLLYFIYKKTHLVLFSFSFHVIFLFPLLMPWSMLTYQGIHKEKSKVA